MLKLKGRLTISHSSGGHSDAEVVRVEILDDEARCIAVRAEVEMGIFARALMGHGYQECEVEFNDSGVVGTIGENKEELVPIPSNRTYGDETWQERALKPFEIDGWKARHGDITNHHRHLVKAGGSQEYQRVVFFRNVPKLALIERGGGK